MLSQLLDLRQLMSCVETEPTLTVNLHEGDEFHADAFDVDATAAPEVETATSSTEVVPYELVDGD